MLQRNIRLAWELARRDLAIKHKRSVLGALWLVANPLALLGIYWLIFARILGVKWTEIDGRESVGYALPFFVGLSVYLYIADLVNSSTSLFASKRVYVVKSPFPLWVLWLANLMRASVHWAVSLLLVAALALAQHRLVAAGALWALISVMATVLFAVGMSLLLSSVAPFIGDISEVARLGLRVLFYATPIAFPLVMVPERFRSWMWINPLTSMIEPLRNAFVFGTSPIAGHFLLFTLSGLLASALGIWVFLRVKGVIADVV